MTQFETELIGALDGISKELETVCGYLERIQESIDNLKK